MQGIRTDRNGWFKALLALLLVVSFCEVFALRQAGAIHSNDFKHLWAGAWLLAHGRNPYDPLLLMAVARDHGWSSINPFVYLPTTGMMLWPLAAMKFEAARDTWLWLNWALLWAIVLAGPRLIGARRPWAASLMAACFAAGSFTLMRQMTAGQMNIVVAALIVAAAWAFRRRREGALGAILAVGFGWKIAPALMIATLIPMRRWRAVAWGVAVSAALLVLSVWVYGRPINAGALDMMQEMGYGKSTWARFGAQFYRDPANMAPGALMHHLFTQNPFSRPWIELGPAWANRLTAVAALILALVWLLALVRLSRPGAAIGRRRRGTPTGLLMIVESMPLFLAASVLMLLLPSLMWDHYAVQLLPALMWIFGDERTWRRPARAVAALVIFALLAIPWNYSAGAFTAGPAVLLMSLRLWPTLALYAWLLRDAGAEEI